MNMESPRTARNLVKVTVGENYNDNDRPKKRQKIGFSLDVALRLAEIGTSKYIQGEYTSAKDSFVQALYSILADEQVTGKILSNVDVTQNNGLLLPSFEDHKDAIDCLQKGIEGGNSISHCVEYDEGMNPYDDLLQLKGWISIDEIVATLIYNIAHMYTKMKLYRLAIAWFQKSLQRFAAFKGSFDTKKVVMTLTSLGYCLYRTKKDEEAAHIYQQGLALVLELNLGAVDLAPAVNCVGIIELNKPLCNTDFTMDLFFKSLALYRSCKNPDQVAIATVLNNIGRVHFHRSEFLEAIQFYKECLQLRTEHLGKFSADVAAATYNLGQAYHQLGRLDEAMNQYLEFLTIIQEVAGPTSKDIALAYKGIADICDDKADYGMALHYYRLTLPVEDSLGDVAITLNIMGNIYSKMNDFKSALAHHQACFLIEKAILEPNHAHIVITMTNIGNSHAQLRDFSMALTVYLHLYQIQKLKFGENSLVLADTMSHIGLIQYNLGQYEASFDSYQEALRIRREHRLGGDDDEHPDIASVLNSIGLVLFRQSRFELAKDCFTKSLQIKSKLLGKNHRDVAVLWYNIGTIHFETGRDELAVSMYKETLRIERLQLGEDHPDVIACLLSLAKVYDHAGLKELAIDYYQDAIAMERRLRSLSKEEAAESSSGEQFAEGRILNLLGNVYLQLGKTDKMMECYIEACRTYESNQLPSVESLVIDGYKFYGLSKTNPPCAPLA